jgi:hypothetical protein
MAWVTANSARYSSGLFRLSRIFPLCFVAGQPGEQTLEVFFKVAQMNCWQSSRQVLQVDVRQHRSGCFG